MTTPPAFSAWPGFLAGLGLSLVAAVPWVCFFLFTQLFGIRLYAIYGRDVCQRVQRRLGVSTHTAEDGKGCGYAVGRWYLCNLTVLRSEYGDRYEGWIIGTAASFKTLTEEEKVVLTTEEAVKEKPKTALTIYQRTGSYYNPCWPKREIEVEVAEARPWQQKALTEIEGLFRRRRHVVAFIHGAPGTGKSMMGLLLAQRLGASFCNTFRPWEPNGFLAQLYSETGVRSGKPMVLMLDEIDMALLAIHEGVPNHKALPIPVANKTGWNHFLDEIGRGMFPHLVLLLTSNRSREFVDELDPSYMRPGRVDLVIEA